MSSDETFPVKRAAGILLMSRQAPAQFLLMRHANRWDLPKGHADAGESIEETALRETEEETGLTRELIDLDSEFRFELAYPVRYKRHGDTVFEKRVVYFLGRVDAPFSPELTEHQGFRWFVWDPPHEIQSQTIDPLLDAVARHIQSPDGSELS